MATLPPLPGEAGTITLVCMGARAAPYPEPFLTSKWSLELGLSTPTLPTGLSDLFPRNFQLPWNSHSHCPASWMVVSLISPPPPSLHYPRPSLSGETCPREGTWVLQPRGLLNSKQYLFRGDFSGFKTRLSLPRILSSLSLDYGVRPKHPWPRGPRPLLSRAQQRKRDGPDMAEYYYDAHL